MAQNDDTTTSQNITQTQTTPVAPVQEPLSDLTFDLTLPVVTSETQAPGSSEPTSGPTDHGLETLTIEPAPITQKDNKTESTTPETTTNLDNINISPVSEELSSPSSQEVPTSQNETNSSNLTELTITPIVDESNENMTQVDQNTLTETKTADVENISISPVNETTITDESANNVPGLETVSLIPASDTPTSQVIQLNQPTLEPASQASIVDISTTPQQNTPNPEPTTTITDDQIQIQPSFNLDALTQDIPQEQPNTKQSTSIDSMLGNLAAQQITSPITQPIPQPSIIEQTNFQAPFSAFPAQSNEPLSTKSGSRGPSGTFRVLLTILLTIGVYFFLQTVYPLETQNLTNDVLGSFKNIISMITGTPTTNEQLPTPVEQTGSQLPTGTGLSLSGEILTGNNGTGEILSGTNLEDLNSVINESIPTLILTPTEIKEKLTQNQDSARTLLKQARDENNATAVRSSIYVFRKTSILLQMLENGEEIDITGTTSQIQVFEKQITIAQRELGILPPEAESKQETGTVLTGENLTGAVLEGTGNETQAP